MISMYLITYIFIQRLLSYCNNYINIMNNKIRFELKKFVNSCYSVILYIDD